MQHVIDTPAAAHVPTVSTADVVLLFADLAGFSDLSARLVAQDKRGAEAIHNTLNPMISAIIQAISARGGLTIGLHGDAVAAIWPMGRARAALDCAQSLRRAVAKATTEGTPLPLRTLLDTGSLSRIKQDDAAPLFAGPLLARLKSNAPAVKADQIHQTVGFLQALPLPDAEQTLPEGWAAIKTAAPSAAWMAEFRTTTNLIAQIDPAPGREVDETLVLAQACRSIAAQHHGQVLHLAQDDKGVVALLGWGLATSATEDDADLAIASGRALALHLSGKGLTASLCIGRGRTLTGVLGTPEVGHFTVLGDHVNRAAGALGLSQGRVLCDADVMHQAQRHGFEPPFTFTAKTGQPHHVAAATQTAERQLRFSSRLVGRKAERARLGAFVADKSGVNSVLWLSGEAGEGKSHLVAELLETLPSGGPRILRGMGDRLGQMTAYRIWQHIFGDLGVAPELDPEALPFAALLNPVLPDFADETPETLALSPVARARRTQDLLGAVLAEHLSDAPALLVLEDAHWMDTASWLLLAEVHRRAPNLRILAVSRPRKREDLSEEAQAILMAPGATTLELGPLTPEDGAELIHATLAADHVSAPFINRILGHTGGHALYTVELVSSLLDTGAIRVENGHCIGTTAGGDLQGLSFPDGVEAAITARISRMPPEDQLLLKVASVQGREFRAAPLSAAEFAGVQPGEIDHGLERLVQNGLIEPSLGGEWRFHHALTREATYDLLTRDQARQLHAATAQSFEHAGAAEPAILAYHWTEAQDPAKALPWLDLAAAQARDADANPEALSFVEQAFEAARHLGDNGPDRDMQLRWHAIAAKSALALGLHDETVDHGHRALKLTGASLPRTGVKRVWPLLGEVVKYKRRKPEKTNDYDPLGATSVLNHLTLTEVYYDRQDTLSLLLHCLAAMNTAYRAAPSSNEAALAHTSMAMLGFHAPAIAKGEPHLHEALRLAETADPATATRVHVVAGNFHLGAGNWPQGRDLLTKGVKLAETTREVRNGMIAMASLANLVRLEGIIEESDEYDIEVQAVGQDRSVAQLQIWGLAGRLKSLSRMNDWETFDKCMSQHRALLSYGPNWDNTSMNSRIAPDLCGAVKDLHLGHLDQGREKLMRAGEMYRVQGQIQVFSIDLGIYFGDAILRLETLSPGGTDTRDLARLMARRGKALASVYPPAKPRAVMAKGDLAYLAGNKDKAHKFWTQAEGLAGKLRMPMDVAAAAQRLSDAGDGHAAARRDAALARTGIAQPEVWQTMLTPG